MSEAFTKWDAADYLHALEDVRLTWKHVRRRTRAMTACHEPRSTTSPGAKNMSRLEREIGISREGLYKTLSKTVIPPSQQSCGLRGHWE